MAWLGTGVKAYRPAFAEPDEVKYAVVDCSASHSSYVSETEQVFHYKGGVATPSIQRYVSETEQVSHYNGGVITPSGGVITQSISGPRKMKEPHFRPWTPALYNRAKETEKFCPRAQVGHRPWSPTRDHGPNKGFPRGTHAYNGSSPPRDHYRNHYKYNDLKYSDDESDVLSDEDCEDGVCYRKGSRPNPNKNHLIGQNYDHDHDHKERHKLGHSYSPPTSYDRVPKKDPYYEKPYPKDNDYKPHKGNDHNNNIPPYKVPLATSPRKYKYYDHQSNNTHQYPPQIKTRIDTHKDKAMELRKDSPRNSPGSDEVHQPQYGSPRKEYRGHPKTIDSEQARRQYRTTAYRGGAYVEDKYKGTIDSLTAARIHKGVFVPN